MSVRDIAIIRDLAKRVADIASLPEQTEKTRLWTACNDLKPERAMVYADPQNGWAELDAAWLHLECQDESLRWIEHRLRRKIVRHERIPDDFPILSTFDVDLDISGAGYDDYGFRLEATYSGSERGSYHIEPVIQDFDDLHKLHLRPIQVDHSATDRQVERVQELLGDILYVRKVGKRYWRYGLTRVLIHMRGLNNMMLDVYDCPELLHELMAFLRDDFAHELDVMEREHGIGSNNTPDSVNGTGGLAITTSLPAEREMGISLTPRDIWCWGESQETVGVGPQQFRDFVLDYQLPLLERFGLVAYGCCEPLDHKIDLLIEGIPNLRWVSVSPWADRELLAQKVAKNYVYVYKPNPSRICLPDPDWQAAEREVRETLHIACGCPIHIVMKDTHTFHNDPRRITRWAEMASHAVREMA
jgi:hypothetical protein